jgi:pimeloyl-ACP methyl ester carboxylesterase
VVLNEHGAGAATTVAPDGVRLWYSDTPPSSPRAGGADAILFLHGFSGSSSAAGHLGDAATGAGLRFIAPDLRGHGYSSKPSRPEDYTIDHLVADVVAVLDACALTSAHVVGHCMGGMVAAAAAGAHPDRVRSLTLVGTSMQPMQDECFVLRAERFSRRFLRGAMRAAFPSDRHPDAHIDYDRFASMGDFYLPRLLEDHRALGADTSFAVSTAIGGFDLLGDIASLKVPTLVVHGARDGVFGVEAAERTAAAIAGARLVVLPHHNHVSLVLDENSRLFAEVLEFVDATE